MKSILGLFIIFWTSVGFSADLSLQDALNLSQVYWSGRLGASQVTAETDARLAKSAFLPDVEGAATIQKTYLVDPTTGTNGAVVASVDQQIINVSNWFSIGARNADYISQACQTEADQIDIYKSVIDSFFAALTNIDEDKLQAKRLTLIQRAVDLLTELTKLRLLPEADLSSAQSQIYQIQIQRQQIEADKAAALNNLRGRLGISAKDPMSLNSQFIQQEPDVTNWAKWPDYIPSVMVQNAKVIAANRDISATQWERFPHADLSLVYTEPFTGFSGEGNSLSVLGTLGVPIFNRWSINIRATQAKRLYAIYNNLLQTQRNQVSNDIATLIIRRLTSKTALDQAVKQMEISNKAYKESWALFRLGKKDFLNVQVAQDVAINAERQWLQIHRQLDSVNSNLKILQDSANNAKRKTSHCFNFAEN